MRKMRPTMSIIAVSGRLLVDGRSDGGGISSLKERLLKMNGVSEVEFNYATDKLTVKYDGCVITLDQIRMAIQQSTA